MLHECDKGELIAKIETKVDRLTKIIEGNGQKGLLEITTILNSSLNGMTTAINSLTLTTNELMLYKSANEGFIKAKALSKTDKQWTYGFIITMLGIIITLIIVLVK